MSEFCKTINAECNPKDCPVEFCKWRDTVWAIKNLQRWAYETDIKPKTNNVPKEENVQKEN